MQTKESEVSGASPASQQSEAATPPAEEGDPTDPHTSLPAGHGMEKNYTDTIESLLSELWKERLVRRKCLAHWAPSQHDMNSIPLLQYFVRTRTLCIQTTVLTVGGLV